MHNAAASRARARAGPPARGTSRALAKQGADARAGCAWRAVAPYLTSRRYRIQNRLQLRSSPETRGSVEKSLYRERVLAPCRVETEFRTSDGASSC